MARDTERNREIKRRREAGETLQAIGDRFGLTKERIRQICADVLVDPSSRQSRRQHLQALAGEWVGGVLSISDLARLAGVSLHYAAHSLPPLGRAPIRKRLARHVSAALRSHGLRWRHVGDAMGLTEACACWHGYNTPQSKAGTRCPPGLLDFLRQLHGDHPSLEATWRLRRRISGEREMAHQ